MSALIAEHFPSETRSSKPHGGGVLWLELPAQVDAETLFDRAIDAGISILPGHVASPRGYYRNFIRLAFGHPWCEATEDALRWLGDEVTAVASGERPASSGD